MKVQHTATALLVIGMFLALLGLLFPVVAVRVANLFTISPSEYPYVTAARIILTVSVLVIAAGVVVAAIGAWRGRHGTRRRS